MRAFIAIEISETIRAELGRFIERLKPHARGVKWVDPAIIHMTLKFLGDVPDESVPEVVRVVRECTRGVAPFYFDVHGTGAFPDVRRPKVIFAAALDEAGSAAELARRLDEGMEALGFEREKRPFAAHLTLGRVREPRPLPELARGLEACAKADFGRMRVEQIVLMQSTLTAAGPVYAPVERVRLTL